MLVRPVTCLPGWASGANTHRRGMHRNAADATRETATDAAAVAFWPSQSPLRARKPHLNAARLTSPLHAAVSRLRTPFWLNPFKTHCALFDGIVIFFRNR